MDMRAVAIPTREHTPEVLELPEQDTAPGELRIVVEAASVNGFDVAVAAGYVWDMLPHEFPVVLGRDLAGTVETVGDGVEDFAVGDRVAGFVPGMSLGPRGTIAERFTAPAQQVAHVPDAVSFQQAAALGLAAAAAVDSLTALDLREGDVVLVSGATGGVGTIAVQLAARRGARVVATASSDAGRDLVRRLGAAETVDYSDDLSADVRAVAPDGVDAVVHGAGDPAALAALLRPGGHLVSVLGADQAAVGRDDVRVTSLAAETTAAKLTGLLEEVAAGDLAVHVSVTYPMADATDALAAFGSGKLGKIVVTLP